jgi:GMP synthase (glutamine-hydrolysing)
MRKILIAKSGSTFPEVSKIHGDLHNWIMNAIKKDPANFETIEVFKTTSLPDIQDYAGVIITGSHADVTDPEPWISNLADWILSAKNKFTPVLGICFGHQLLAQAFGGMVDFHPAGQELGYIDVHLNSEGKKDPLLGILPDDFFAYANHAQTVKILPENGITLAGNNFDKTHAFSLNNHIWGVQFHPEYTEKIMKAQIRAQRKALLKNNKNPEQMISHVKDVTYGSVLLQQFYKICSKSS